MKKTLLAVIATILLSSCNNVFYQVYDTKTSGLMEQSNLLVYENQDCKIIYNLWDEKGNIGFIMQNKTDKDLFLALSRTFFIKNGEAFDYFTNKETSYTEIVKTGTSTSISKSIYGYSNIFGSLYDASKSLAYQANKSKGYSSTVTTKERPIICIPANSHKYIKGYSISDVVYRNCNNKAFYPRKESVTENFNQTNSPLTFKNIISYSYNEDGSKLTQIENVFWISGVKNYSKKRTFEKKNYKECEEDTKQTIKVFKMASPSKFYNSYKRQ